MQQSPSGGVNSHAASQEIIRLLWEPEGSLPYSQQPATGHYPEENEIIP
jgi:hypothetical protein